MASVLRATAELSANLKSLASDRNLAERLLILRVRRQFYGYQIRAHIYLEASSSLSCAPGASATIFCKPLSSCSDNKGLGAFVKLTFVASASFSEILVCRKLPLLVRSCTTPGNILGGGGVPSIQDVPFTCNGDVIIDDDLAGLL